MTFATDYLNALKQSIVAPTGLQQVPVMAGMTGIGGGGVSKIKPAIYAGGALLAGLGIGSLFGGKKGQKQEQTVAQEQKQGTTTTTTTTTRYDIFAPQYQYSPTTTTTYDIATISESPYATMDKKSSVAVSPAISQEQPWFIPLSVTPTVTPSQQQAASQEAAQSMSDSLLPIAIIAAVGLVAYGLLSGRKKKK